MKKRFSFVMVLVLVLSLGLVACGKKDDNGSTSEGKYTDGVFTGKAATLRGELNVEVTVEGGNISKVEVTDHEETEGMSDPALEQIPAAIVEANSPDVDTVSGATETSEAIIEAVKQALK